MDKTHIIEILDKAWHNQSLEIDWLKFERDLIEILRADDLADEEKVQATKELLDAFTKRDHFHNPEHSEYLS